VHKRKVSSNSNSSNSHTGVQDWPHGPGAYKLGLVMGQHDEIIEKYRDTDIIARFGVHTRSCSC